MTEKLPSNLARADLLYSRNIGAYSRRHPPILMVSASQDCPYQPLTCLSHECSKERLSIIMGVFSNCEIRQYLYFSSSCEIFLFS